MKDDTPSEGRINAEEATPIKLEALDKITSKVRYSPCPLRKISFKSWYILNINKQKIRYSLTIEYKEIESNKKRRLFSRLVSVAAVFKGNFEINGFLQNEMASNSFWKIMAKFSFMCDVLRWNWWNWTFKSSATIFLLSTRLLI